MALTVLKRGTYGDASLGQLITYQGSDPAAGVEWSEAVPATKLWRVLSIDATLVTSAVANNRKVRAILDDAANVIHRAVDEGQQAASLTHLYHIAVQNSRPVQDVDHYIPLPFPEAFMLPAGFRVRSSTLLLDAGDNWGAPVFTVQEYDLGV